MSRLTDEELERLMDKVENDPRYEDVEAPPEFFEALSEHTRKLKEEMRIKEEVLSDREKEALEIGLKVLNQREDLNQRRKARRQSNKAILTAACVACFFVVALVAPKASADDGVWGFFIDMFGGNTKNKVTTSDNYIEIEDDLEFAAYEEAEDLFGEFVASIPANVKGLQFDSAEIVEDANFVDLRYNVGEHTLMYNVKKKTLNDSTVFVQEEVVTDTFLVQGDVVEFVVHEYTSEDTDKVEYNTIFHYEGLTYTVISDVPREVFEEILNKIIFF